MLRLPSLPFSEVQKIPQQLVLHAQPLDLVGLLRYNIPGRSVLPWPALETWKDTGFQPAFFSPLSLKQPFYYLFILKTVVFCNFSLAFPSCQHLPYLWQQRLYMRVSSFLHDTPPDVVYFPTSGGLLSLSVFTGPVERSQRTKYPLRFRRVGCG